MIYLQIWLSCLQLLLALTLKILEILFVSNFSCNILYFFTYAYFIRHWMRTYTFSSLAPPQRIFQVSSFKCLLRILSITPLFSQPSLPKDYTSGRKTYFAFWFKFSSTILRKSCNTFVYWALNNKDNKVLFFLIMYYKSESVKHFIYLTESNCHVQHYLQKQRNWGLI